MAEKTLADAESFTDDGNVVFASSVFPALNDVEVNTAVAASTITTV